MKRWIFIGAVFFVLLLLVLIITSYDNDTKIKKIAFVSIESQYNNEKTNLDRLYAKEFIEKISNDKMFYKRNLGPYKILNIYTIKKNIMKGDYSIGVRISDRRGEYIQVMHIKKTNNSFYIFDIEYDI